MVSSTSKLMMLQRLNSSYRYRIVPSSFLCGVIYFSTILRSNPYDAVQMAPQSRISLTASKQPNSTTNLGSGLKENDMEPGAPFRNSEMLYGQITSWWDHWGYISETNCKDAIQRIGNRSWRKPTGNWKVTGQFTNAIHGRHISCKHKPLLGKIKIFDRMKPKMARWLHI